MNSSFDTEYDYLDEEEIDIVKLVSTNVNDANQYLVFQGSDNQYYGKNVSKIEEIVEYKDLDIVTNNDDNIAIGSVDIRGEILTLVNFDNWIGNEVLNDEKYELVIIVHYGGYKFGIVVKSVEDITTIESEKMYENSSANSKSTFISKIELGGKEKLCTIFDSDMLLLDLFESEKTKSEDESKTVTQNIQSNKLVLLADDSRYIRNLLDKICSNLDINYQIFENGKELIDTLKQNSVEDIGLIVTDIEMPVMNGKDVVKKIREDSAYDKINIVIHTNMANIIMETELLGAGANKIIGKVNALELARAISEHIR